MFRSGIQLPADIAGFHRYGRYDAGMAGIFSDMKQEVEHTELLADTVYSGRTGWYGTELITLLLRCESMEILFSHESTH